MADEQKRKKASKLHEILAVEGGLEKTAKKLVLESKKTFAKENLFSGSLRELNMFSDVDQHLNTSEFVKLESTVDENLSYALKAVTKHWDVVVQKDKANQIATADVVIDDITIISDVPATTLLGMESKLSELRSLFEAIPTLPPGIIWNKDNDNRAGIFKAQDDSSQFKTEKDVDFRVLYEATKEHPAQIREFNVTKNVGKYNTTRWSGMITPHRKAELLTNLETLLAAVKKARQRANNALVENKHIGKELIDFILHN